MSVRFLQGIVIVDQLAEQSAEAAGLKGEDFELAAKFKVKSIGAGESA